MWIEASEYNGFGLCAVADRSYEKPGAKYPPEIKSTF